MRGSEGHHTARTSETSKSPKQQSGNNAQLIKFKLSLEHTGYQDSATGGNPSSPRVTDAFCLLQSFGSLTFSLVSFLRGRIAEYVLYIRARRVHRIGAQHRAHGAAARSVVAVELSDAARFCSRRAFCISICTFVPVKQVN